MILTLRKVTAYKTLTCKATGTKQAPVTKRRFSLRKVTNLHYQDTAIIIEKSCKRGQPKREEQLAVEENNAKDKVLMAVLSSDIILTAYNRIPIKGEPACYEWIKHIMMI